MYRAEDRREEATEVVKTHAPRDPRGKRGHLGALCREFWVIAVDKHCLSQTLPAWQALEAERECDSEMQELELNMHMQEAGMQNQPSAAQEQHKVAPFPFLLCGLFFTACTVILF